MLIIEIALGVVLAFFIIAYFDRLLAMSLILFLVLLAVIAAGGIALFIAEFPKAIVPILIGVGSAYFIDKEIKKNKKSNSKVDVNIDSNSNTPKTLLLEAPRKAIEYKESKKTPFF